MADDGTNGNMDTSGSQQNDDDRKLFAGGLAQEATEKDITEYFGKFGEVASVNLKMDQMTGRSRGFAFVVFVEVDTLTTVLSQDHAIKGKKVAVKKAASKQGKIYIGKFKDPTISEDVIREHFTQYGQVVEIQRPVDRSKNSEPKNFCFVTFDKEEPANALLLTKKRTFFHKKTQQQNVDAPALFWKNKKKNPKKKFPPPPNTLKWWYYYCTSKIKTNKKWPKKNQIKFPEKKNPNPTTTQNNPKNPSTKNKNLPHTTIFFYK